MVTDEAIATHCDKYVMAVLDVMALYVVVIIDVSDSRNSDVSAVPPKDSRVDGQTLGQGHRQRPESSIYGLTDTHRSGVHVHMDNIRRIKAVCTTTCVPRLLSFIHKYMTSGNFNVLNIFGDTLTYLVACIGVSLLLCCGTYIAVTQTDSDIAPAVSGNVVDGSGQGAAHVNGKRQEEFHVKVVPSGGVMLETNGGRSGAVAGGDAIAVDILFHRASLLRVQEYLVTQRPSTASRSVNDRRDKDSDGGPDVIVTDASALDEARSMSMLYAGMCLLTFPGQELRHWQHVVLRVCGGGAETSSDDESGDEKVSHGREYMLYRSAVVGNSGNRFGRDHVKNRKCSHHLAENRRTHSYYNSHLGNHIDRTDSSVDATDSVTSANVLSPLIQFWLADQKQSTSVSPHLSVPAEEGICQMNSPTDALPGAYPMATTFFTSATTSFKLDECIGREFITSLSG
jgi:hypothetical protein